MDKPEEGWTAPKTYAEVWERFSARAGDSEETRAIHLKWIKVAAECGLTSKA